MPIELRCSGCQALLPVPDKFAGKRVKCPKCQVVLEVPAAASGAAPVSSTVPLRDLWYLKTEDGEDYGPVPKAELDNWLAEGRITADCQILQDGQAQWQWANDVYPQLKRQVAPPAAPPEPRGAGGAPLPGAATPSVPMSLPGVAATPRTADVQPDAFSFAAKDATPISRLRGRGRPAKKPAQRPLGKSQAPAASAPAPREAAESPAAAAQVSGKSRLVAGLLGLFLGFLGVHRFYLGYPLWGVFFLLTGGGFVLGALADAVLILLGHVPDAQGRPLRG